MKWEMPSRHCLFTNFATALCCQYVPANLSCSRPDNMAFSVPHRNATGASPPPHSPCPSLLAPLLRPIPSRSFNKAKPEIGRSTRHPSTWAANPYPTRKSTSSIAPPHCRGTWQPNRPYTPPEKGRGDGCGRDRYLPELEARRGDDVTLDSALVGAKM